MSFRDIRRNQLGHVTRWVTAEEKEGRRDTQGLVAAAHLPDYRLNGADCAGLAAHLTDVILASVEIGPRGSKNCRTCCCGSVPTRPP